MRREEINARLRQFVREHLSPLETERQFVSTVYDSVGELLGRERCLQIGSYPRFTAVTPVHDLDVLYFLGPWAGQAADGSATLREIERLFREQYNNPTRFRAVPSPQSHSVTVTFVNDRGEEVFSIDVVPAYTSAQNEFGQDTYMVPEIVIQNRRERRRLQEENQRHARVMKWIPSDPRGYISLAQEVNASNEDFRKAVKLIKGWRASCKQANDDFPLKSFHLEQIITEHFRRQGGDDIFGAVFSFLQDLPIRLMRPTVPDRANPARFIDAYVADLTSEMRSAIKRARDHFLLQLEEISPSTNIGDVIAAGDLRRVSSTESFLFDSGIPTFTEAEFTIEGDVLPRDGGFRSRILDKLGRIEVDRRIRFRLGADAPGADIFKWKVRNDSSSPEPRGEITDHHTRHEIEHTKYRGSHYVECYAIRNGACIARAKQSVVLGRSD